MSNDKMQTSKFEQRLNWDSALEYYFVSRKEEWAFFRFNVPFKHSKLVDLLAFPWIRNELDANIQFGFTHTNRNLDNKIIFFCSFICSFVSFFWKWLKPFEFCLPSEDVSRANAYNFRFFNIVKLNISLGFGCILNTKLPKWQREIILETHAKTVEIITHFISITSGRNTQKK